MSVEWVTAVLCQTRERAEHVLENKSAELETYSGGSQWMWWNSSVIIVWGIKLYQWEVKRSSVVLAGVLARTFPKASIKNIRKEARGDKIDLGIWKWYLSQLIVFEIYFWVFGESACMPEWLCFVVFQWNLQEWRHAKRIYVIQTVPGLSNTTS